MNRLNKEAHTLEEINGVKCAVVEKNVSEQRAAFLKYLLETNHYTVHVTLMPPPKVATTPAAKAVAADGTAPSAELPAPPPPAPELFIVGVTDLLFHPMLAVYERSLKTKDGKVVSIAYWNQEEDVNDQYYWMLRKR